MSLLDDLVGRLEQKATTAKDPKVREMDVYRSRAVALSALLDHVEAENRAYDRWACDGFPPRGAVYAEAYKAHQRLGMAAVAARKIASAS